MLSNDLTTMRTIGNISKTLANSLKHKYNISDNKVVDDILKIHGLHKENMDFLNNINHLIINSINDVSIDDNSNKNEKTIEGIMQESFASAKKAIGYDYLYRKIKELFGADEAKRITGELFDLSLGLSDSTNVLKNYSYYKFTPLIVKINGKIKVLTFEQLFDKYSKFATGDILDKEEILTKNIKTKVTLSKAVVKSTNYKGVFNEMSEEITEDCEIQVWDNKNSWVNVTRIIKHKNHTDFILYEIENGDFALVTDDHPVIMEDKTEKKAGVLQIGDLILREDVSPIIKETVNIPEKFAYLLGFLLGGGNVVSYDVDEDYVDNPIGHIKFTRGGNLISIYQKDIDNSRIVQVVKELFPEANLWKFTANSNMQINFSSMWFNQLFAEYFDTKYKENSFSKTLFSNVLRWKKESKEALIAGLIDSDGTVFKKDARVSVRIKAYAIINVLYEILITIGSKGVRKSLNNRKDINEILFGVNFRPTQGMMKHSEKLQKIDKTILQNCVDNYDEKYSTTLKTSKVKTIIRFNKKDIISDFFRDSLTNVYDITTTTGRFYANGMVQHNCWSLDASKIVLLGRNFGQLHSAPSKRVESYVSALCETIHQMSSHLAGAIAIGTFFLDIAHLSLYKEKIDLRELKTNRYYRKKLENEFQQFIHSVNHLSRNGVESPFTNVSIFDRVKLKTLVVDMQHYFPFDQLPINIPTGMPEDELEQFYFDYIIDYILEVQDVFLDFFDKGDPVKDGVPYRFPVVTINLSKKRWGDKTLLEDIGFLHSICKRDIYRYNIFVSEGTKVCSCCRLINDTELMSYASQSNSFGGGGSISLGSHRVCTINFMRIALEANSKEHFYQLLDNRIKDTAKVLKAHKELIKDLTKSGLQQFVENGWIIMDRLFSTYGILGIYEATKLYKQKFGNGTDIEGEMLVFMNDKVEEYSKSMGLIGNIEQIPGESFAVRLAKADKLIYGEEKVPYQLYANQFIPLWEDATLWEKMDVDGKYNQLITGGGIVHATIGEKVTSKQAENIIKYAVNSGCEHFALNAIYSMCENNHMSFGDLNICPVCQGNIKNKFTRVVGFFTPVASWNPTRRDWEFPRRTKVDLSKI